MCHILLLYLDLILTNTKLPNMDNQTLFVIRNEARCYSKRGIRVFCRLLILKEIVRLLYMKSE